MSGDRVVRYRCTSRTCVSAHVEPPAGRFEHLHVLAANGCPRCGCKRLEILNDPRRGHYIIDWGSPKSRRKQKAKEARLRQDRLAHA